MSHICTAQSLRQRYTRALTEHDRTRSELQDLEATLSTNDALLSEWKAAEAQFIQEVTSPDAHHRNIKSPYAPQEDHGEFTCSIKAR